MNILILSNKLPYPAKDGGSIATLNLAKGLAEAGNKICILSLNTIKHYFDIKKIPSELIQVIEFIDVKINTKINLLKLIFNLLLSKKPYIAERFKSKKLKIKLQKILKERKIDIVQIEGLYMCQYIPCIKSVSSAKISYRAHNIESEIWRQIAKNSKNIIKKLYLKILANRVRKFDEYYLNKYDFLIPITQVDAKKYASLGVRCPIHVLPAGIDVERIESYKSNKEINSIFFIGALDWIPNQEGLLWFLKEVLCKIKNIDFYIAGRNATQNFIKILKNYNLNYLGEVEDAYDFMASNSIMVVPLFSGSGMRIKILEGMAMGKIIVSTSLGAEGIEYSADENIIIANNAQQFIEKISMLNTDNDLRQKVSKNAKKYVHANFNNFNLAKYLNNFYLLHLEKMN